MAERYRLPDDERDAAVDFIARHEDFRPNMYYDTKGVPTTGYGTSLTERNGAPWPDAAARLRAAGVSDAQAQSAAADLQNRYRTLKPGEPHNEPLPTIAADKNMSHGFVVSAVDAAAPVLREKFGQDAAGNSNWDKLSAGQRTALLDAHYNAPELINKGITSVIRNQDDPAWRDKAWWEMAVNVKEPDQRRLDEANTFTTNSFLKSPVENRYADRGYTRNLLNSAVGEVRANMLNASEEERRRAGVSGA